MNNKNKVDRQSMLNSHNTHSKNSYMSDFKMCRACYDYLSNSYLSNIHPSFNSDIESVNLSARNLACLENVMISLKNKNAEYYWHELADFIHNYNSNLPVSYNEYHLFKIMFEIGNEEFN